MANDISEIVDGNDVIVTKQEQIHYSSKRIDEKIVYLQEKRLHHANAIDSIDKELSTWKRRKKLLKKKSKK